MTYSELDFHLRTSRFHEWGFQLTHSPLVSNYCTITGLSVFVKFNVQNLLTVNDCKDEIGFVFTNETSFLIVKDGIFFSL